jgi:HD-like signal output (HDOD) protein
MGTNAVHPHLTSVLNAAQLPALPHSAIELLKISQNPASGPREFARPIEADPGLMGQVLRFVNSSYFGFARQIANVSQALTLVGVRPITNFALWSAVFSLIPNPNFGSFNLRELWQDSLRRAIFARRLAKRLQLAEAEDLFAAALLQDMAIPLLLKELPEGYQELLNRRRCESQRLSSLERATFGWDHAEAAAALVRGWNLPESFATLIERHPDFDTLLAAGPTARAAACVALASMLPSGSDEEWPEQDAFRRGLEQLGGGRVPLAELVAETDAGMEEFAPLLKLPVPRRSLAQWCQAAASPVFASIAAGTAQPTAAPG